MPSDNAEDSIVGETIIEIVFALGDLWVTAWLVPPGTPTDLSDYSHINGAVELGRVRGALLQSDAAWELFRGVIFEGHRCMIEKQLGSSTELVAVEAFERSSEGIGDGSDH